ncbi:MAG: 4-(cytidine 5'-diphospho)-2-C-methyl-D-erythritol kinase [Solirubrobacteraceae bacterium]
MSEFAPVRALAPAKINLGLFVGPVREQDGRHELVSVMQSISLADELTLEPAPAGTERDVVECPGVPGPAEQNLAARALEAFRRRTGWDAPPVLLRILKRIPLAAGLAGGSADAAATLRLAAAASGLGGEAPVATAASGLGGQGPAAQIAAELGADVPAQLAPGRWLASGAGERLAELPPPRVPFGVLVLPAQGQLSTAAVFAEADRLGAPRGREELRRVHGELASAFGAGAPLPVAVELLHNDLQRAAVSLLPAIAETLREARGAGAAPALLSGSGPTVLGLFARGGGVAGEGLALARHAAAALGERTPAAVCAVPVEAGYGAPVRLDRGPGTGHER